MRLSQTAGNTATITFAGTHVAWVATKETDRGIATVRLDGGPPTTVDLYGTDPVTRSVVYRQRGLAPGPHTMVVTVSGTKNPASTGIGVDIDAVFTLHVLR